MFTSSKLDSLEEIQAAIGYYTLGLNGLRSEPDGQDSVERYRPKAEKSLEVTSQAMQDLLLKQDDSEMLLTSWADRVRACQKMLDTLDKNLVFKGKRQWNWEEVIGAMAFLEVTINGAQSTLRENGIDL